MVAYKNYAFLVSSRHVVTKYPQGHPRSPRSNLAFAFEKKDGKPELLSIEVNQKKLGTQWSFLEDDKIDLAVTPIGVDLEEADVAFIHEGTFGNWESTNLGEDIFFIGFPLGITPGFHVKPVVRSGIISLLFEDKSEFLLDAISKGGNSGSPVFSKTRLVDPITSTIKQTDSKLLGIIKGHIPDFAGTRTALVATVGINKLVELLDQSWKKFTSEN